MLVNTPQFKKDENISVILEWSNNNISVPLLDLLSTYITNNYPTFITVNTLTTMSVKEIEKSPILKPKYHQKLINEWQTLKE